jgi:uncharacterized protein
MARRTGSPDLPLLGGRVPPWLAERMAALGAIVCQASAHHHGRAEFLQRLSHPFWFQSFWAVMGMDWHSSGITTSVIGALKRGQTPLQRDLAIHVCGGQTAHELTGLAQWTRNGLAFWRKLQPRRLGQKPALWDGGATLN